MDRLEPKRSLKIDRVDVMLACALAVVIGSYAMGYKLDWSQLDQGNPVEAMVQAPKTLHEQLLDEQPEHPSVKPPPVMSEASVPATAAAGAPVLPANTPTMAADPKQEAWGLMTSELARHAQKHPGRVAIFVKDLKSSRTWTYHSDDLFPSASLIKVPIMISVVQQISDGKVRLSDKLTMRRKNRVGGSGSLKWRPDGTRLEVRELLYRMINESDNTATNMLIELVGMDYLQKQFPKIGLLYTGIYQEGMSIQGGRVAHENYTTAREMSMMLEKIYRGEMIDPKASALMLDILKHRRAVSSRLAKGLPKKWEIAHKTGLLRQACHDSAIIFSGDGDYVITVLTGQNRDYTSAKNFISQLGRITFRHYGGYPHYYAKATRRSGAAR